MPGDATPTAPTAPAAPEVHVHVPVWVRVLGVPTEAQRREVAERARRLVADRVAEAHRRLTERRQVRRITLRKADRVAEYLLADGSRFTERVLWHADPPPRVYPATPAAGRLTWSCPEELRPYLGERRHLIETSAADRARNPGTLEGVATFEFEVVGERVELGYPGLDDALGSAQLRRYLVLRGRYHPTVPALAVADVDWAQQPAEIEAVFRLHDRLAGFTELDWALLAARWRTQPPAGSWTAADRQIESFVDSSGWRAVVAAAARRDARIEAAFDEIDPAAEDQVIARLSGLEAAYSLIKAYEAMTSGSSKEEEQLKLDAETAMDRALHDADFVSVYHFDQAVWALRLVVRRRAMWIALTRMKDSERVLQAEVERYRDPALLVRLAGELAPWRRPPQPSVREVAYLLDDYPILRSAVALHGALAADTPEQLGDTLRQNAEAQLNNIVIMRERLQDEPEVVFRLDLVIADALAALGLDADSVHGRLIRDERGKPITLRAALLALVDALLLILSFAAGPVAWLGYLVRIGFVGQAIVVAALHESDLNQVQTASLTGAQLATRPDRTGLSGMVGLAWALLGAHLGGGGRLVPGKVPAFRLPAVAEELATLEPGLQVRLVEPGTVEVTQAGRPGALRITAEGWQLHATPGAATPVLAAPWSAEVPAAAFAREPGLAGAARTLRAVGGRAGLPLVPGALVAPVGPVPPGTPLFGPDDLAGLVDESGLAAANPGGANLYRVQGDPRTVGLAADHPGVRLRDVNEITVADGPAPLLPGDPVPPVRPGQPVPETWLLDPNRAALTGPAAVDVNFRPNMTEATRRRPRTWHVRNAELGGPGAELATPTGPQFGPDRVVGGARGAVFDPVTGTWLPAGPPVPRPYLRLGHDAPFAPHTTAEWHAWELASGPLTDEQRYVLWFYSDDLSSQFNPALRGDPARVFVTHPVALAAAASDMDSAMRALPFDAVLYRDTTIAEFTPLGVQDPAELVALRGRSLQQQTPLSTSVAPDRWSGDLSLVIEAPKGTRARYLGGTDFNAPATNPVRPSPGGPISSNVSEGEVLLERGTTFTIQDAQQDPVTGRWTVRLRVAEQGGAP